MLPQDLLPNGALESMRNRAKDFMRQTMYLYKPTLSYDEYGKQVASSGVVTAVNGYIGNISGTDRELVAEAIDGFKRRDGIEVRKIATFLFPYGTTIDSSYVIMANTTKYHVIWDNNDTMDGVQLYTKAIGVHLARRDEEVNYG